jgi:DNA-binding NarL/FixJ family response regulator
MSSPKINVAVVHDSFLTHAGLTATFAACADMTVSATHQHDAALQDFDVVVADWRSGLAILDAARRHRAQARSPRVAIVASSDLEWQIRQAVQFGAAAYMLISASGEELIGAVRSVHEGRCHLSPSIAARLAQSLAAEPLTAREQDVLALVMEGLCNKRISRQLDIGVGTVKTHLRAAFDKLQVRSRAQAVVMVKRRGILRQTSAASEQVHLASVLPFESATLRVRAPPQRRPQFDALRGS